MMLQKSAGKYLPTLFKPTNEKFNYSAVTLR